VENYLISDPLYEFFLHEYAYFWQMLNITYSQIAK